MHADFVEPIVCECRVQVGDDQELSDPKKDCEKCRGHGFIYHLLPVIGGES